MGKTDTPMHVSPYEGFAWLEQNLDALSFLWRTRAGAAQFSSITAA